MISTRMHGILDYVVGILLILAPWLFGFIDAGAAGWVMVAAGVATIGYSLLTHYEFGLIRVIPYRVHLALDAGAAAFLLLSPWFFGFWAIITWPHVVIGLFELCTVALSRHSEPRI